MKDSNSAVFEKDITSCRSLINNYCYRFSTLANYSKQSSIQAYLSLLKKNIHLIFLPELSAHYNVLFFFNFGQTKIGRKISDLLIVAL